MTLATRGDRGSKHFLRGTGCENWIVEKVLMLINSVEIINNRIIHFLEFR